MQALTAELGEQFEPLRVFRPNRDLRFTIDPALYKTWAGATSAREATGGIGYYLKASPNGITSGYGAMLMTSQQLRLFRAAIDDHTAGA